VLTIGCAIFGNSRRLGGDSYILDDTQSVLFSFARVHKVMFRLKIIHRNTHIINKPCLEQNCCIRILSHYVTLNSIRYLYFFLTQLF